MQALENGGTVGVSVVFAIVIRALWSSNKQLTKDIEKLQEKRVQEAKEVTDTLIEYTREQEKAMDRLSTAMDTLIRLQKD